jgi:hypothetical protein
VTVPGGGRRLSTLPFRALLEISSLVTAQRGVWTRTTRKLVGAFISCGRDTRCGTGDDLRRRGGY